MSANGNIYLPDVIANGAMTNNQYHFCKYDTGTDDIIVADTTAGTHVMGVIENTPADNGAISVLMHGLGQLVVDGNSTNIAQGDFLKCNASGHGIKIAADNDAYNAIALKAATADGVIIPVFVCTQRYYGT